MVDLATDIADLLANPPSPGQVVEIDAFFGGEYGLVHPGHGRGEAMTGCPSVGTAPLTDRPYRFNLTVLSSTESNELPDGAAWLVAATAPESVLRLPFHGRFRGRLGDPRFSQCEHSDRIFLVDAVVREYAPSVEEVMTDSLVGHDPDAWAWLTPSGSGYTVAYPRGWQVDGSDPEVLQLRSPDWPAHPIVVSTWDGGTSDAVADYQQHHPMRDDIPPLTASLTDACDAPSDERCAMALLSGSGRTYAIALRYPIGFEASQPLLYAYRGIVDRFHIEGMPAKTPTPPVKSVLGDGPFWSREQAEDLALLMIPSGPWRVASSQLVPEAEARRLDLCDIDGTVIPSQTSLGETRVHPEGVWIVRLVGHFDGRPATYNTYLDGVYGHHLCTAEEGARSDR